MEEIIQKILDIIKEFDEEQLREYLKAISSYSPPASKKH